MVTLAEGLIDPFVLQGYINNSGGGGYVAGNPQYGQAGNPLQGSIDYTQPYDPSGITPFGPIPNQQQPPSGYPGGGIPPYGYSSGPVQTAGSLSGTMLGGTTAPNYLVSGSNPQGYYFGVVPPTSQSNPTAAPGATWGGTATGWRAGPNGPEMWNGTAWVPPFLQGGVQQTQPQNQYQPPQAARPDQMGGDGQIYTWNGTQYVPKTTVQTPPPQGGTPPTTAVNVPPAQTADRTQILANLLNLPGAGGGRPFDMDFIGPPEQPQAPGFADLGGPDFAMPSAAGMGPLNFPSPAGGGAVPRFGGDLSQPTPGVAPQYAQPSESPFAGMQTPYGYMPPPDGSFVPAGSPIRIGGGGEIPLSGGGDWGAPTAEGPTAQGSAYGALGQSRSSDIGPGGAFPPGVSFPRYEPQTGLVVPGIMPPPDFFSDPNQKATFPPPPVMPPAKVLRNQLPPNISQMGPTIPTSALRGEKREVAQSGWEEDTPDERRTAEGNNIISQLHHDLEGIRAQPEPKELAPLEASIQQDMQKLDTVNRLYAQRLNNMFRDGTLRPEAFAEADAEVQNVAADLTNKQMANMYGQNLINDLNAPLDVSGRVPRYYKYDPATGKTRYLTPAENKVRDSLKATHDAFFNHSYNNLKTQMGNIYKAKTDAMSDYAKALGDSVTRKEAQKQAIIKQDFDWKKQLYDAATDEAQKGLDKLKQDDLAGYRAAMEDLKVVRAQLDAMDKEFKHSLGAAKFGLAQDQFGLEQDKEARRTEQGWARIGQGAEGMQLKREAGARAEESLGMAREMLPFRKDVAESEVARNWAQARNVPVQQQLQQEREENKQKNIETNRMLKGVENVTRAIERAEDRGLKRDRLGIQKEGLKLRQQQYGPDFVRKMDNFNRAREKDGLPPVTPEGMKQMIQEAEKFGLLKSSRFGSDLDVNIGAGVASTASPGELANALNSIADTPIPSQIPEPTKPATPPEPSWMNPGASGVVRPAPVAPGAKPIPKMAPFVPIKPGAKPAPAALPPMPIFKTQKEKDDWLNYMKLQEEQRKRQEAIWGIAK